MWFRKHRQPWYTYPIVFIAVVYGAVQAELHTRFIWKRVIKKTAWQQLLAFLDRKFPPKSGKSSAGRGGRSRN